jgi:hypothetical protein
MEGIEIKDNNPGAPEVFEEYWGKMESHLRSRYSEGNILFVLFGEVVGSG